jgi:hypothetical protein
MKALLADILEVTPRTVNNWRQVLNKHNNELYEVQIKLLGKDNYAENRNEYKLLKFSTLDKPVRTE